MQTKPKRNPKECISVQKYEAMPPKVAREIQLNPIAGVPTFRPLSRIENKANPQPHK